jgi:glutathione S-transferase
MFCCFQSVESKARARYKTQTPGVVYYYAFTPHPVYGQSSAPCVKLEAFLRLHKLPYQTIYTHDAGAISPTGRFPFIELDGETIPDSNAAIAHLIKRFNIVEDLDSDQLARGISLRRILEDSARLGLYRFQMVEHCDIITQRYVPVVPVPQWILRIALRQQRKGVIEMLNLHGYGDLTDAQYQQEFLADVQAVERLLLTASSSIPYGDGTAAETKEPAIGWAVGTLKPTRYDACVYAMLTSLMMPDLPRAQCPALSYVAGSAVFKAFLERFEAAMGPSTAKVSTL